MSDQLLKGRVKQTAESLLKLSPVEDYNDVSHLSNKAKLTDFKVFLLTEMTRSKQTARYK
jgi:hypothetical protein